MISLRKTVPAFGGGDLEVIQTENEHVLGYIRARDGQRTLIFANFSENQQIIPATVLEKYEPHSLKCLHGLGELSSEGELFLVPFDLLVLG